MKIANYARLAVRAPTALSWTLTLHSIIRIRKILKIGKWKKQRGTDLIGLWGKGLAWIMGVRIVRKNERQGEMGDLIISNHMGFLDVPILLSVYPSVFIIKNEARKVFFFGQALVNQGHVFVDRSNKDSRNSARDGLQKVLEDGDRIIVFPEGKASPGATRLPFKLFSFFEANRQNKKIEACVIDYLPDRSLLKWDTSKSTFTQLVDLFGRRRTMVSVEFFPPEFVTDPEESAKKYHDLIENKLIEYDQENAS